MTMTKKIIANITVSVMLISSMAVNASAYDIPQKLVDTNTYTDEYGYIVNECIWEDATNMGISTFALNDASWIGVSDSTSTGRHRSAKEYGYSPNNEWCWRAAAQTELKNASDNSPKYHYTRARVINPWVLWEDIRADSDRVWGLGTSTARTDGYYFDSDFALRSYWGY